MRKTELKKLFSLLRSSHFLVGLSTALCDDPPRVWLPEIFSFETAGVFARLEVCLDCFWLESLLAPKHQLCRSSEAPRMHSLISTTQSRAGIAPCRTQKQQKQHSSRESVHVCAATGPWQGDLQAFKRLMVLPGGAWFMSDADAEAPVYGDSFVMQRHAAGQQAGSQTGAQEEAVALYNNITSCFYLISTQGRSCLHCSAHTLGTTTQRISLGTTTQHLTPWPPLSHTPPTQTHRHTLSRPCAHPPPPPSHTLAHSRAAPAVLTHNTLNPVSPPPKKHPPHTTTHCRRLGAPARAPACGRAAPAAAER